MTRAREIDDTIDLRREHEQATERLARIQSMAAVGAWELDLSTNRLWWSDEVFRIFEIDPTRFGASYEAFLALIHPEDQKAVDAKYRDSLDQRRAYEAIHRIVMADGRLKYVHEHCRHEFDGSGEPTRSLGTVQDITRLVQLESDLLHSQKLNAVGRLTAGLAHEFNNLLTIITASTEAMQRALPSRPNLHTAHTALDTIRSACARGERLTDHLLAYSRQQNLRIEPVDANRVLLDSQPLLATALGNQHTLQIETAPTPCVIEIDKAQLEAALLNLVTNARDSMAESGSVRIRVRREGARDRTGPPEPQEESIHVSVGDSGCGMTAREIAEATAPFYSTKSPGEGTGLGLSMVKGFVEQSNGRLDIESTPRVGTTVTMSFPSSGARLPTTEALLPTEPRISADRRVLLVEDDELLRRATTALLRELELSVVVAADGDSALEVLDGDPGIDTVLTDLMMPGGMTGFDLAERALEMRPSLRVVVMSGHPIALSELPPQLSSKVGALQKPFDPVRLLEALQLG